MKRLIAIIGALLLVTLAACGGGSGSGDKGSADGSVFRWGTTTIPTTLDPTLAGSDAHVVYFFPIYETLIHAEPDGSLSPALATEWSLSPDGLTFDLTLRSGVKFQDGTPFNSEAVAANIAHGQAQGSILAPQLALIDSVEPIDPTHVRLHLNRPGGDLPELFRGYAGMMASPAAIQAGTLDKKPVGAGPYKATAISDSEVSYERWPGYWNAKSISLPKMQVRIMTDDNARLSALKSGQLDGTFIRPNQVAEAKAAGLSTTVDPRVFTYGLYLNPADPALSSPDVRKAISHAIDRKSIDKYLYDDGCTPTAQLYPKQYWAYSKDIDDSKYIDYDADAAKAELQKAAPGGLSFTILTPNITNYQQLAETIQDQLKKVGVKVEVEAVDSNESSTRQRSGQYQGLVSALYSANPDPAAFAAAQYKIPGTNSYLTPELPTLIDNALLSVDRKKRADAMGQVSKAVLDAGTNLIPVCIPDMVFAFNNSVKGMKVPILGNYDFRDVSMTAK